MAELVLFHHVQGLTDGVRALGDDLRGGGHVVHTPDLFEERVFGSIEDGFAYLEALGDGVKLLFKEDFRPARTDALVELAHQLGPRVLTAPQPGA